MGATKMDAKQPLGEGNQPEMLADCLVEGNEVAGSRTGRYRGRAMGASALAQALVIGVVILVPLFATGSKLVTHGFVVTVPWGGQAKQPQQHVTQRPAGHTRVNPPLHNVTQIIAPTRIPNHIEENGADNDIPTGPVQADPHGIGSTNPNEAVQGISSWLDSPPGPRPTVDVDTRAAVPKKPVEVSQGAELALLIHRVEPIYPALAKMTRTEGTVQLHAIISRDGRILNLEVMSGHVLLATSARDAVMQWRFRPTLLNGQHIEVETYITVVFRLGGQ